MPKFISDKNNFCDVKFPVTRYIKQYFRKCFGNNFRGLRLECKHWVLHSPDLQLIEALDGRNRARVIAESLARVIAAIRIASVHWRSHFPLKTKNLVLVDPAFVIARFESRDWRSLV